MYSCRCLGATWPTDTISDYLLRISLLVIIVASVILYLIFQPGFFDHYTLRERLPLIYSVFFLIGAAKGFYSPSSSSLKPFLVPRAIYHNSSTWSSSFWQAGSVMGPGIAGFLYVFIGLTHTLLVVIGCFVVCLVLISMIGKKPIPVATNPGTIWQNLREGLSFVFKTRIVFYAISLDLFSVLFGGVVAILPVFAEDILHVGPQGLGLAAGRAFRGGAAHDVFHGVLSTYPHGLAQHAGSRSGLWGVHHSICAVGIVLVVVFCPVHDGFVR